MPDMILVNAPLTADRTITFPDASGTLALGGTGGTVWSLLGNAGTNAATNFVGTTDAVDLVLRANNTERVRVLSAGGVSVVNGPLNLTNPSGTAAELRLFEPSGSGSEYTAFKAQAQAVSLTYTLPAAQGAASTFLRNDGVGGLSWAAAGLSFFTEAQSTAAPNATIYVDSLTAAASTADADLAIIPKRFGALMAAIPDNAVLGGNKRGIGATDWQRSRTTAFRVASGSDSVIGGGADNLADATGATVGGGYTNAVSTARNYGTIGGGQANTILTAGTHGFIGGGQSNTVQAAWATVAGGLSNDASGNYAFVGGGTQCGANAAYSFIGGGFNSVNTLGASASFIGAGTYGRIAATGLYAFVGAGGANSLATNNEANGQSSAVVAGDTNTASAQNAFIGAGSTNNASGTNSVIVGGSLNAASAASATVAGGSSNTASGIASFIGGGTNHIASGDYSVICGGSLGSAATRNSTAAPYSFIGSGTTNTIGVSGSYGVICGGLGNTLSWDRGFIGAGASNQIQVGANEAGIASGNGNILTTNAGQGFIGAGQSNTVDSRYGSIPGGQQAYTRYRGELAHANGQFAAQGDAQNSFLVLRRAVTVALGTTELTFDGNAVSTTTNTITLTNNSMLQFIVKVSARDNNTAGQFAWWNITGGIGRSATDTTTTIVGVNVTNTGNSGGNSAGWTCVVQADATAGNGRMQILVSTPASGGTVRFVASVYLTRSA